MIQTTKEKLRRLLAWSERYTKTDMIYVARGSFWITLGRVVAAGSGFLLTLLLANTVSKETLGTYKFVQSAAGIVAAFSLSGMGTAITQSVARGNDGALHKGFRSFMRWSVVMTAIAWGAAAYYFWNGNMTLGWSLVVIGAALPLSQGGGFYSPFLIGKKDFEHETKFGIFATVTPILVTGVTALFTQSVPFLILAFFGSGALVGIILYRLTIHIYAPALTEEKTPVTYGKHLSFMNILGMISSQLDRILVFHYLGAAQMAIYSIALAVPQQLRFGSKLLAAMSLPKFSGADPRPIFATLPRKALLVFLTSCVIVLIYIVCASFFFKIFFPQYLEAVHYSQIFSLVILFFPAALFQQFFVGQMQQKWLYVLQVSVPVVKIVLLFILLPIYGILGALFSILGMEVFRIIAVVLIFRYLAQQSDLNVNVHT
jgi:O-antigen/teichoic acid export membrane protein